MRARDNFRDISVDGKTVVNIRFPTFQKNILVPETPGTNCLEMWQQVSAEWSSHIPTLRLGSLQNM